MDITETRRRAIAAQRLKDDADLAEILSEIEAEAATAMLRSGGDPANLRDAWRKAMASETLRNKLQTRIADGLAADKREQRQ